MPEQKHSTYPDVAFQHFKLTFYDSSQCQITISMVLLALMKILSVRPPAILSPIFLTAVMNVKILA
jgi:hypothetical protein